MWREQTSEQKMNQKGWEKSSDGREQKRRLWCSQGAWRGPARAPYSRQGREKVEGGMGHVRCYSTFLPYLRRLTLPPNPRLHPISPSTPPGQHMLGSQPSLSLSGRMGSRGGDAGRHEPTPGQGTAKGRPGPLARLTQGLQGRPKMSLSHPQPWPSGSSSTNHNTLPRPSPLPPK